ncbi:hypothetical protein NC653_021935 [Populus alba x Populus x berolinensis]|uniref:Uncharacterized protein n=1 Tax=Populus alba x Populus x berolinensis TaxID=444605 RepID=A0AAD6QF30_9ROSI|nr:hypothetical protein NC653_021935 [Populus alba x Populus x berolinensis]
MSTEVAAANPTSTQSPGCKRSKANGTELSDPIPKKVGTASKPLKRRYLTRSKAATIPCMGIKPNTPAIVSTSLLVGSCFISCAVNLLVHLCLAFSVPVCQDCREFLLYSFIPVWSLLWRLMGISPAWLRIYTRLSAGWLLLAGIAYCFGG